MARLVARRKARSTEYTSPAGRTESAPPAASPLLHLQRSMGNHGVGGFLQEKLRVGATNDRYEAEADHIADLVMSFPHEPRAHEPPASAITPTHGIVLQPCSCGGSCPKCAAHDGEQPSWLQRLAISPAPEQVQREATESCSVKEEAATPEESQEYEEDTEGEAGAGKEAGKDPASGEQKENQADAPVQPKRYSTVKAPPADLEERLKATQSEGGPLPLPTRRFMENRFGYDFSHVRVHTGASAQQLSQELNALAFTTGHHIYFGSGQFQPGTRTGQHLLAHELTHVIQQSGGAAIGGHGMVRESAEPGTISRAGPERKMYYGHRVSGVAVHGIIERLLRAQDKDLVTEAAIPGSTRFFVALNNIGVADLYKSTPARTVSGVKGLRDVDQLRDIITMNNPDAVGTAPAVTSSPTVHGRTDAPTRTFQGDFPSEVHIGEIKPLGAEFVGLGITQLDNYDRGYKDFVKRINHLSGTTRSSISVKKLDVPLPAFLDFDNWATQHNIPERRTTINDRRLWAARIGGGVHVYFDLSKGLTGAPPKWQSDQLAKMREIRSKLGGGKHPRTDKMEPMGKFLPGGPQIAPKPDSPAPSLIQRSTKDRPDNYWKERGKEWEEERSKWGKGYRGTLKTTYREYREKLVAEKRLGRSMRSAPSGEQSEVRDYKQLLFWSGLPGRFIGKIRFLLGSAWDKILGIFETMKEKLSSFRKKVSGTSEESASVGGGWKKTLIKILIKAAKFVLIKFITESFNFFVDCFHSAMDKVWAKLQKELTERFAQELCNVRKLYDDSKDRLEKNWGISFKQLGDLLETIQDVKHWVDIANNLINLIRLGVQIISCLEPPALGCLWGLVAQIGIGTALDLLIGTQWFNDNIIKPTIGELVRKYAGPYYQRLINDALGDDLKEYHCHIADQQDSAQMFGSSFNDGLKEGSSELIAHRDDWTARNQDAMLKDLQTVFQGKKGKKVTLEELQQLADYIKKSNKSPADLKKMLESARDPLTGRFKFEEAQETVKIGELPEPPAGGGEEAKKRKIDYPKATKRNKELQRSLGWDPFTFYKKPGITADSEEFADAIYDTQVALRISADGIVGEQTLLAFYDRNKLKQDAPYLAAVKVRDDKQAAKEKAEREKAEREKPKTEDQGGGSGDLVAIQVGAPPPGTTLGDWNDLPSSPAWFSIPFGRVEPDIKAGETHVAGETLNLSVRHWAKPVGQWVWFTDIPVTFDYLGEMNFERMLSATTAQDFFFKLTPQATVVYKLAKGSQHVMLDWGRASGED